MQKGAAVLDVVLWEGLSEEASGQRRERHETCGPLRPGTEGQCKGPEAGGYLICPGNGQEPSEEGKA